MGDTRESAIRVRLEPELKERLETFQRTTRRSLTNAVNLLLDEALAARTDAASK